MKIRVGFLLVFSMLLSACGEIGVSIPGPEDQVAEDQSDTIADFCTANPGAECNDEDPCTVGVGICTDGACKFETVSDCTTGPDECSVDGFCDEDGGCVFRLAEGHCRIDDQCYADGDSQEGNPCMKCLADQDRSAWSPVDGGSCLPEDTTCSDTGKCEDGFCMPTIVSGDCVVDEDCAAKDDGNICNGIYRCRSCQCVFDTESVVVCDWTKNTPCATSTCQPESGACYMVYSEDTTPCEDGDLCTTGDLCYGGTCTPGSETDYSWIRLKGPTGAWIETVAAWPLDSSRLLAAGLGGRVFVSEDSGFTWSSSGVVASGELKADSLATSGADSPVVVVIFGTRLYRSGDGGHLWEGQVDNCETVVYLEGSQGNFAAVCNKRIWLSSASGKDWTDKGLNAPGGGKRTIEAFYAEQGASWYIGTKGEDSAGTGKLYVSKNAGATWEPVLLENLPAQYAISHHGIMVKKGATTSIFVGLQSADGKELEAGKPRIYRSTDGGTTFTAVNTDLQGAIFTPLLIDSAGKLLISADSRLYGSTEAGNGPMLAIPGPTPASGVQLHGINTMILDPLNPNRLLVPSSTGVAAIENEGGVWSVLNQGMVSGVHNTVIELSAGGAILASNAMTANIEKSDDGGLTWTEADPAGGHTLHHVDSFAQSVDGIVAATTIEGGLASSSDGGASWDYLDPTVDPPFAPVTAMTLCKAPAVDQDPYLMAFVHGVGLWRHKAGGIKTEGTAWELLNVPISEAASLLADPQAAGVVHISSQSSAGTNARIYRSADYGDTWTMKLEATGNGFRVFGEQAGQYRLLAALVGKNATIYQSTNSGTSWSVLPKHPTFANVRQDTSILPPADGTLSPMAAIWLSGLWKFDESQGLWAMIPDSPKTIISLARDTQNSSIIYGADGVAPILHISEDNGLTWKEHYDFGAALTMVHKVVARPHFLAALVEGPALMQGKLFLFKEDKWVDCSDGLPGAVLDIEEQVNENQEVFLLASTLPEGLFRSADLGKTWQRIEAFPKTAALDLEVSPKNFRVLLAAVTCGALPDGFLAGNEYETSCGIFRSDDDGATWNQKQVTPRACNAIGYRPDTAETYAACDGSGLFRSINDGIGWQNITISISMFTNTSATFSDVALWANYLVLGSVDSGPYIASGPVDNPSLLTWNADIKARLKPPIEDIQIVVDPGNAGRFLISAMPGGVFVSDDNANHWFDGNGKLNPLISAAAGVLPTRVNFMHFGGDTRIWATTVQGGLWSSIDGVFWEKMETGIDQMDKGVPVFIGEARSNWLGETQVVWLVNDNGVFRTSDAGQTWAKVDKDLPTAAPTSFIRSIGNKQYLAISGSQAWYLKDGEDAWVKTETILPFGVKWPQWPDRNLAYWNQIVARPGAAGTFWMASDPAGLWTSADGGGYWERIKAGLPSGPAYSVAFDRIDFNTLYVGTGSGPYVSTDLGVSFAILGPNWAAANGAVLDLHQAFADTKVFLVITEVNPKHGVPLGGLAESSYATRRMFLSRDGGTVWEECPLGTALAQSGPSRVLTDPARSSIVYVVTAAKGVYRSMDSCQTWEAWNDGLPGAKTGFYGLLRGGPLGVSVSQDRFRMGTSGFGIYERVLDSACE